jgi:hypothetical protein
VIDAKEKQEFIDQVMMCLHEADLEYDLSEVFWDEIIGICSIGWDDAFNAGIKKALDNVAAMGAITIGPDGSVQPKVC